LALNFCIRKQMREVRKKEWRVFSLKYEKN
jgi:hypothetical protein